MGYYTNYKISVKGKLENKQRVAELEKAKKEAEALTGKLKELALAAVDNELNSEKNIDIQKVVSAKVGYNPFGDQTKWYEHENDMKAVSKEYPDVIFKLEGEGGNSLYDIWVKYFVNGKMQTAEAKITFDDFDEKKLK